MFSMPNLGIHLVLQIMPIDHLRFSSILIDPAKLLAQVIPAAYHDCNILISTYKHLGIIYDKISNFCVSKCTGTDTRKIAYIDGSV